MKKRNKYNVVITCPDCSYGQDPLGCFDGGKSIEEFTNLKEAIKSAEEATCDSIWEYEIEGASKDQINKAYRELYGINFD